MKVDITIPLPHNEHVGVFVKPHIGSGGVVSFGKPGYLEGIRYPDVHTVAFTFVSMSEAGDFLASALKGKRCEFQFKGTGRPVQDERRRLILQVVWMNDDTERQWLAKYDKDGSAL